MPRSSHAHEGPREAAPTPPGELSYEAAMDEARRITDQLDRGEIGLEQSLAAFQRATELLQRCRSILEAAELQVKHLTEKGELEGWEEDRAPGDGGGSGGAEGKREP
jgi:exodeoxyribonuclease VII small subunit